MSYHWSTGRAGERGGIRAESRSGGFGQTWVSREWFDLLAHSAEKTVLANGASMARRGAVQSVTVMAGRISGRVLEYNTLYAVEMDLPPLSAVYQEMLLDALAAEPILASQILGGVIPREIFSLDSELQLGLFPAVLRDFDIACGCYRWEVPCKHATAVHLLVAEELDHDPLLFLVLRGLDRAAMLRRLSGVGTLEANPAMPVAPLSADPQAFWHGTPATETTEGTLPTAMPAAPLPPFPFWGGSRPFDAVMADYLSLAADHARKLGK